MRIFSSAFITESSDLSPISLNEADWRVERFGNDNKDSSIFFEVLTLFRDRALSMGWEFIAGICASAYPPGGRLTRSSYEGLRDEILKDLKQAMPVDGVILQLHGAAMAHGYDDCEGELLVGIRRVVGSTIPIAVELDPHCHLTRAMIDHSTLIVLYKTLRHTDIKERADELFTLFSEAVKGNIKPTIEIFDCRLMNSSGFDELVEPMKSLFEKICDYEKLPDVLSISPVHGFPLADIPDMGSRMLVITDNNPDLAKALAQELGIEFYKIGKNISQETGVVGPLLKAKQFVKRGGAPIPIVDFGDLVGCGFPTDNMDLLHAMLSKGMKNVAVGMVWDPLAVTICQDAGVNSNIFLRIGGKASVLSGVSMDLEVSVIRLYESIKLSQWSGEKITCDVAVVSSGETDIFLASKRILGTGVVNFEELGVDVSRKQYLLVKHAGGFSSSPITCFGDNWDYKCWNFKKIGRPKWPWDKHPFKAGTAIQLELINDFGVTAHE